MKSEQTKFTDIAGIARPARTALAEAGYTHLEQLVTVSEKELAKLHGMGPKALRILREKLTSKGMDFKV